MNINLFKVLRAPEGDSGGVAVADPVAAPEAQEAKGIETQEIAEGQSKTESAATLTDWQAYKKMQEKYANRPQARPTKAEVKLMEKYNGKDESAIPGYEPDADESPASKANKPKASAERPSTEVKKDVPPAVIAIPKSLEALIGSNSPVGAKTIDELPAKVDSLHKEFQKLNGERGAVGRLLQEAGVPSLAELQKELSGARSLHKAIQDAKAGNQKALEYLGFGTIQQTRQEIPKGVTPDGVLDDALFNHLSPQLAAAHAEIAELKKMVAEKFSVVDRFQQSEQQNAMSNHRRQEIANITNEFATLAAENPHLWDSKSGNLHKAIADYYAQDGDYHPGLKVFNEILAIAKEHKTSNLELALAYWERKNRGSIIQQAKESARQPFIGKAPTVGLSDQQGAHGGQFTEYTKSQLQNLGRPGYPRIPDDWRDAATGDLIPSKIPAYARQIVLGTDEE